VRLSVIVVCLLLLTPTQATAHTQRPAELRMSHLISRAREVRDLGALRHGWRLHGWGRRQMERMIDCYCVRHAEPPPFCKRWGQAVGIGLTARALFRAFMASPEHRRILLDPDFTRIGVGARRSEGLLFVAVELC
jgi:hypothetical protein